MQTIYLQKYYGSYKFNLYCSIYTDIDFFLLFNKKKPNKEELIDLEKKLLKIKKSI